MRHKTCPTCHYPIPDESGMEYIMSIPLSEYHVRCERCKWPVAKVMVKNGLCWLCSKRKL